MKIETNNVGKFIITRGSGMYNGQAFAFFVDGDRTSWTGKGFFAQQYGTREEAEKDLAEIKRRDRERRQGI